ncbi:MAG: hypothetical protein F6K36_31035 [Symploca sp. SIO3C6]|nr:hypothetical protein [Symploca sp. SIO3C6]
MLAPYYYVGVSFWVTRQRLPLSQVPVFRVIQGLALIGVGYLGVAWFLRKIRILVLSYIPFQYLLLLFFGLIGVMYLGYLRMRGLDQNRRTSTSSRSSSSRSPFSPSHDRDPQHPSPDNTIDDELDALRRELEKDSL